MRLIIATHNPYKVKEFDRILSPFGIEVVSQSDIGVFIESEETSNTFEGNSYLKAKAVYDVCHLPTIADDSGLKVYALNNAPGVFSARYGGEGLKDTDRVNLLLQNMKEIPDSKRGACFVCCITLILNDEKHYTFTGMCEGKIAYEPKGKNGFGYDPVFLIGSKSFSEISEKDKDTISHRGIALRKLRDKLEEIIDNEGNENVNQ